jgi:hypothetical protein
MTSVNRKRLKRTLGIAAGIGIAAFLLPSLVRLVEELSTRFSDFNLLLLAMAFSISVLARPLNALGWRMVLAAFGYRLPWKSVVQIWITAEAYRWLPGGVWHFGSRTAQSAERGIPILVGIASVALELLLTVAASFLIAVAGVFIYSRQWLQVENRLSASSFSINSLRMGEVVAGIIVLGSVLFLMMRYWMPEKFAALRERFSALRKNPPRPLPTAFCLLFYTFFVFVNGIAFYFTMQAVCPQSNIPLYAAITVNAMAWMIGLIPVGAPAGIGVREAILAMELSVWIRQSDAILIAVLWRFVLMAAELLCVVAVFLFPLLLKKVARHYSNHLKSTVFKSLNDEE